MGICDSKGPKYIFQADNTREGMVSSGKDTVGDVREAERQRGREVERQREAERGRETERQRGREATRTEGPRGREAERQRYEERTTGETLAREGVLRDNDRRGREVER